LEEKKIREGKVVEKIKKKENSTKRRKKVRISGGIKN
jgi:hypothetical protein